MPFNKFAYRKSGETRISIGSRGSALSNSILFSLSPRGRKKFIYRLRKHNANLAVALVLQVSATRSSVDLRRMVLVKIRKTKDFLRANVTSEEEVHAFLRCDNPRSNIMPRVD